MNYKYVDGGYTNTEILKEIKEYCKTLIKNKSKVIIDCELKHGTLTEIGLGFDRSKISKLVRFHGVGKITELVDREDGGLDIMYIANKHINKREVMGQTRVIISINMGPLISIILYSRGSKDLPMTLHGYEILGFRQLVASIESIDISKSD